MSGALKYVFLIVAIACYMQMAEMRRLPRDAETPQPNLLDSITKPEFWNSLSQNVTAFGEENLKKYGIDPANFKDTLSKVANDFQQNFAELAKNMQGMIPNGQAKEPAKDNK